MVLVLDERSHGQGKLVAGGVKAAEDQQHERVTELSTAELVAGGVRCDEGGHAVVARRGPAVRYQSVRVSVKPPARALDLLQAFADPDPHRQAEGRRVA